MSIRGRYDIDSDGKVTKEDIIKIERIKELESKYEKAESQKLLAWVAMISILIFTAFLFTPYVSIEKLNAIADLSGMFYIAMASIIGAFMGFTTYLTKR